MAIKFIKSLALFLLPLAIAFAWIEYLLSQSDNIYTVKRKMLEHRSDSLEVLILGTSQAFNSLNPAYFKEPTLNLAAPGQLLYYDCKIVLNHLPQLKKLKLVILPIDYFSLFIDMKDRPVHVFYYHHYWKIDHPSLPKTDIQRYSLLFFLRPKSVKDIFSEMIIKRRLDIPFETAGMLENGFRIKNNPADTIGFAANALLKTDAWNKNLMSKDNFIRNAAAVENMVNILQQKNIKVLIISTPVLKNIYEKYDSSFIKTKIAFVKQLAGKYPNILYHDFSVDPRFGISDFYDPNHLDSSGAVKFSKIISDEYVSKMTGNIKYK